MNSFQLIAVGNLARDPELVTRAEGSYARLCLIGNEYAGRDEQGATREDVTSLWLVAFGNLAQTLAHNTRKGDQLILTARVRESHWTDAQGEKQYDHSFIVEGFRFGAPGRITREARDRSDASASTASAGA